MQITRGQLNDAVARRILDAGQGDALWDFLAAAQAGTPGFKPAHILYYLGGMIAIGAMTLFMTLGWEIYRGAGLVLIALAYAAVALWLTGYFLARALRLPAGITAVLAIVMVPLAVYGLQHLLGFWPPQPPGMDSYRAFHVEIDWRWLLMELATLAAGAVALWQYRLPFLMMPVAVTLWYMGMDLTPFLFGGDPAHMFEHRAQVSTWFGAGMGGVALWVDLRSRRSEDFAFWLYIFAVLTFWGGLTATHSDSQLARLGYCGVNLLLIAIGAALSRRVFVVFGGIGVALYLGQLSYTVFKDSLLFPLALTAIGLGVVACGVRWERNERAIGERLRCLLPASLRELLQRRASA